jgi:hypothetical protein
MQDEAAPWRHAMTLSSIWPSSHVSLSLIKDGGQRLSREEDLNMLSAAIDAAMDNSHRRESAIMPYRRLSRARHPLLRIPSGRLKAAAAIDQAQRTENGHRVIKAAREHLTPRSKGAWLCSCSTHPN